jgi:hypothetical protein
MFKEIKSDMLKGNITRMCLDDYDYYENDSEKESSVNRIRKLSDDTIKILKHRKIIKLNKL